MELRFNKLNGYFFEVDFLQNGNIGNEKKKGTFCHKYMIFENKIYQNFKNSFVGNFLSHFNTTLSFGATFGQFLKGLNQCWHVLGFHQVQVLGYRSSFKVSRLKFSKFSRNRHWNLTEELVLFSKLNQNSKLRVLSLFYLKGSIFLGS